MKKITAIVLMIAVFFSLVSCAGAPLKEEEKAAQKKERIKADRFQADLGVMLTIGGIAGGAYWGYRMTPEEGTGQILAGVGGGLIGGGITALVYWLIMQAIGPRETVDDKPAKTDPELLMPKK